MKKLNLSALGETKNTDLPTEVENTKEEIGGENKVNKKAKITLKDLNIQPKETMEVSPKEITSQENTQEIAKVSTPTKKLNVRISSLQNNQTETPTTQNTNNTDEFLNQFSTKDEENLVKTQTIKIADGDTVGEFSSVTVEELFSNYTTEFEEKKAPTTEIKEISLETIQKETNVENEIISEEETLPVIMEVPVQEIKESLPNDVIVASIQKEETELQTEENEKPAVTMEKTEPTQKEEEAKEVKLSTLQLFHNKVHQYATKNKKTLLYTSSSLATGIVIFSGVLASGALTKGNIQEALPPPPPGVETDIPKHDENIVGSDVALIPPHENPTSPEETFTQSGEMQTPPENIPPPPTETQTGSEIQTTTGTTLTAENTSTGNVTPETNLPTENNTNSGVSLGEESINTQTGSETEINQDTIPDEVNPNTSNTIDNNENSTKIKEKLNKILIQKYKK